MGAYFSKPDWHSNDYWWRNFATPDRNVNYSIERYPERWERFVRFTHSQVLELVQGYGPLDVLWLDGGWVRPRDTITPDVAAWCKSSEDQDVDMPALAAAARRIRPGLLIVDRTVHGPFEDYRTPEQEVPDAPLPHPWETCMTIATQWSYKENDPTKSARQLVHTLVRVVAAGGNFLLNVGPSPEGDLPPEALERLAEVGAWLDVCGEAIYGTRPATPWRDGEVYLTRRAEDAWALVPLAAGTPPPTDVRWRGLVPRAGSAVRLLGHAEALAWDVQDGTTVVRLPEEAHAALADALALALAFTPEGG
jgi:alpha-L-fucosidase